MTTDISQELIERIQDSEDDSDYTPAELLSYIQHYIVPQYQSELIKEYAGSPIDSSRVVDKSRCFHRDYVVFEDGSVEFDEGKEYKFSEKIEKFRAQGEKDDKSFHWFMEESNKRMVKPLCTHASKNRPVYRSAFWASRGLDKKQISKRMGYELSKIDGYIKKYVKHIDGINNDN